MADPRFAIVVTTIGTGEFLDTYAAKLGEEGQLDRATMIVIIDRKTPAAIHDAIARARAAGLDIRCPDLAEQDAWLARLGAIHGFIPWNSDARRNIGYLMAYESGADVIVGIDDDNLCELPGPWLGDHAVVAAPAAEHRVTRSASGWYNPCALLETDPAIVHPRGYPYARRNEQPALVEQALHGRIDVNAGLWLGAPDIDAFSHLAAPVEARSLRGGSVILDPGSWAPVNTQNTAIRREAMGAWWFARMGVSINGLRIERFGDIWSGYFLIACARHLGGLVRFGTPLVMHRRNSHDIGRDALHELPGIWLTEDIVAWLHEHKLSGSDYVETYRALADGLDAFAGARPGPFWTASALDFIGSTTGGMRAWADAIRTIDGRPAGS
jgi:hypothetical protein